MTKALPWWYNEESEAVLNRGYLLHGETVHDAIYRITSAAARRLYRPELQERFAELIYKGWMSCSSPVWSNMGTSRGLPISCSVATSPTASRHHDQTRRSDDANQARRWHIGLFR